MPRNLKRHTAGPCSVAEAVEVLGEGWKGDILWHLKDDPQRFMELRRLLPSISPKVLTQALRSLERDGLVNREHHPEIPPRVEYSMTSLGRSTAPVLQTIADWWRKHGEAVRNPSVRK